jgi:hypothetical protein
MNNFVIKLKNTVMIKSVSFFFLFVITLQYSYSQCEGISIENIINFRAIGIDSVLESEGLRNGPDYDGATLYYPNNLLANYKSIILVTGYQATEDYNALWGRFFASRGFACMTIGTNSLYDYPIDRAHALLDAMETIRYENNRTGSPLYNKLDTNAIAVGGYSMGGGAAQLAAAMDSSIKTVIAFSPWLETSTLTPGDLNHSIPALIISGENDATAPAAQHANVHYNYTPSSTNKLLFEIIGGSHYSALIPDSWGYDDVGNVAFAWMNLFLNDDPCYCEMLALDSLDQNGTFSDYITNLNCSDITTVSEQILSQNNVIIYPNPVRNDITVESVSNESLEYEIINIFGSVLLDGTFDSSILIKVNSLPSGTYFLRTGSEIKKFMKLN